jgi:hypothetical protein
MGDQKVLGQDAVPELGGLDHEAAIGLLDRAAGIGLLESLGPGLGYYRIHPALPWYFTTLFTTSHGPPGTPAVQRATRAYTQAIGALGNSFTTRPRMATRRGLSRCWGRRRPTCAMPSAWPAPTGCGMLRPGACKACASCMSGPAVMGNGPVSSPRSPPTSLTPPPAGRGPPRRSMEHHHRPPGPDRAASAGLACRHHPANRTDRVVARSGRCSAGRPPGPPHPPPAHPDPRTRRESAGTCPGPAPSSRS